MLLVVNWCGLFDLTVKELGTLGVSILQLLTFVGSSLHVAVRGGEHRRP